MVRALQQVLADPKYLEFFGMAHAPFAPVTDRSQYFQTEQDSLLLERLQHAATTADSLLVVCGPDGCGKSTLQDVFLAGIERSVSSVVIDQNCRTADQFYRAFLTRIGFEGVAGTTAELTNITKEFLVCRGLSSDHVLLILDNAHLATPVVLEQLRLLCELKVKDQRPVSLVLFGNFNIVHVVDAPAMQRIRFRNHNVFSFRRYTERETADYVWHRIRMAGGEGSVLIPNESHALIHEYSDGIPLLINKLCHEVFTRAEAIQSNVISAPLVESATKRLRLLPHTPSQEHSGRRKTDIASVSTREQAPPTSAEPKEPRAELATLQSEVKSQTAQVRALKLSTADLQKDLANARATILDLTRERQELQQAIASADRESAAQLSAEQQEANVALSSLQQELASKTRMIAELRSALEEARSAHARTQREFRESTTDTEELRASIQKLNAELGEASERALNAYALERKVEELAARNVALTLALENRDDALAEAEAQLEAMHDTPQSAIETTNNPEQIADDIGTYRTLRICNPAAYRQLAETHRKLKQLGLNDEQIRSGVRMEQATLMEELLPKASDGAIVSYMQLAVHQLSEFIMSGTEPCLSCLVPKPDPVARASAQFSSISADRELEVLDAVVKTYDSTRQIPAEELVWTALEPIFAETMEEFGADSVAAIENSFDPDVDRRQAARASKSIYMRILALPRQDAANAARWLLTAK